MLDRKRVSLLSNLALAGVSHTAAAESIVAGDSVRDDPALGVGVILQANVEYAHLEAAGRSVVRRVRRRASYCSAAYRE